MVQVKGPDPMASIVAMGYLAFGRAEEDAGVNPFKDRTPEAEAWKRGWKQAEKDADFLYSE